MDDTLLQFGHAGGSGPRTSTGSDVPERRHATVCPTCTQHFSADGRFCPFDGEPLQPAPDWDPSSDPLLGTVVDGRYEIQAVLGEGGMGVVYQARHCALGKRFALKALRKDLASDADIAARFMQEARTAAAVSHPGLVEITDFGTLSAGQPFFVMELLEGQSLATVIRRGGPIPAARGVDIVRQIAGALGAAHEQSIVHRDLKPDNIYISPGGPGRERVTILDFGLAKVIGAGRVTRAGMVFGTPHYMSPEQAMGEATDHRADVYALGIVMYEMFTGRVPFEADSYMGVLTKHMYMAPMPPSQHLSTADVGVLEDIILRCLEKKPEHRYATLRELIHDLDLALNLSEGVRSSTSRSRRAIPRSLLADELELPDRAERGSRAARTDRASRWAWPVMGVGGLFLIGALGVLSWRHAAPSPAPSATTSFVPTSTRGVGASVERAAPDGGQMTTSVAATSPTRATSPAPLRIMSSSAVPALAATTEAMTGSTSHPPPSPKRASKRSTTVSVSGAPATPNPPKPAGIEASEIVDPWAKER